MLKQGLNFMAYTSALEGFSVQAVLHLDGIFTIPSLYLDVITRVLIGEFLLHDRNDNKFTR
jgi:hypothetical protein